MPRIRRGLEVQPRTHFPVLLAELDAELRSPREAGQPLVEEETFPRTNAIRVSVLWDKWEPVPDDERSAMILQAYEQVESKEFRDRIALAIGLTVPEAYEAGMLPYQIMPALRPGDVVTPEQCREAMVTQGASLLLDPDRPLLRFPTEQEAEACRQRLIRHLLGSEPVWVISKEAGRLL